MRYIAYQNTKYGNRYLKNFIYNAFYGLTSHCTTDKSEAKIFDSIDEAKRAVSGLSVGDWKFKSINLKGF